MLSILAWCFGGGAAGWLFGPTTSDRRDDLLRNVAVGVIGGVIGGYVFALTLVPSFVTLGSLVAALFGAIVLSIVATWVVNRPAH